VDWINELLDLYEKNRELVGMVEYKIYKSKKKEIKIPIVLLPVFHTTVAAQITVDISEDGNFLDANTVRDEDKMTIIPVTEASGSRTAGIEPHPYCDNLKYLAGDYMQYVRCGKKDFSENHKLYMESLQVWRTSKYAHKKVKALCRYLEKGTLIRDLVNAKVLLLDEEGKLAEKVKIQAVAQTDAFVRFRIVEKLDMTRDMAQDISGIYEEGACPECWLDKTLQDSYISYYRSVLSDMDICYLTGKVMPISYLQPKKIRNEGDGAKLISSNDESNFTFRGRFTDKKEAFAIGYESSQEIHNALKWIIRKQGSSWDGLCIVVWESDLQPVPEWSADTDSICDDYEGWGDDEDEVKLYVGTGRITAERFRKAMDGYGRVETLKPDSRVVILVFDAATTGRLAMFENQVFEKSRYVENVRYWHESGRWQQTKYKDGQVYTYMGMAGIRDIAEALYGTERDGILSISGKSRMYAEIGKRLLPCVTGRRKIPHDMVNLAVEKASSPLSYEKRYNWEKVLSIACSLVKKERLEREKEDFWNMEVNTVSTSRDYLYGRLLAVADRIEYRTYDKEKDGKRVTNAKRYMNKFSQSPYQTWKILEEKLLPYFQKLDVAERNFYYKLLDDIYHLFDENDFVNNSRLEGVYLLGYHSQSYEFRYKEEKVQEEQ